VFVHGRLHLDRVLLPIKHYTFKKLWAGEDAAQREYSKNKKERKKRKKKG